MKLKNFIFAIWELPQNVLGFAAKMLFGAKKYPYIHIGGVAIHTWKFKRYGMSLGKYIFIPDVPFDEKLMETILHEWGHTIQSRRLGWLYIPIIAIPSFLWANCGGWYRKLTGKSYYWFYTESWANKLGGVEEGSNAQND